LNWYSGGSRNRETNRSRVSVQWNAKTFANNFPSPECQRRAIVVSLMDKQGMAKLSGIREELANAN